MEYQLGEKKSGLLESLALLQSRRFGPFLACSFFSNIGTWMQLVAEPWLLLKISGSSFLVGLDSFMMSGPVLLLIFLGGILADKRDRRNVILFFQSIQMLCPLLLILLLLSNALSPWMIIALSLAVGITDALSMPAFQSIIPLIVARKEISRAIALNSAFFNLARVAGPALGGWMMAKYGPVSCFSANVLSYIPFVAAAFLVLPPKVPAAVRAAEEKIPRESIAACYGPILRQPRMRGALYAIIIMTFFCSPILAFSSVMVSSVLHGGVGEFGNSMAAFGLGGLLGAALLLLLDERVDKKKICSGAAVLFGLTLVAASFARSAASLHACMVLSGSLMAAGSTSANSILQQTASQQRLGRAVGLFMFFMRGGMALGNLAAGILVTEIGVSRFLLLSGALAAVLQTGNYLLWKNHGSPEGSRGSTFRESLQ